MDTDDASKWSPLHWAIRACCLGVAVTALVLAVIVFVRLEHHTGADTIDAVCNRGDNSALNLPGCPAGEFVPGVPLMSGDPSDPGTVYASRLNGGTGVGAVQIDGNYVELTARVVSLSSALTVGASGGPDPSITLDLNATAVNLSDSCDIECERNYYVRVVNGASGFGIAMGTDHVFVDDNTHRGSAILSGISNILTAARYSVVVGGRYNNITSADASIIGAGRNNTILSDRSAIVSGDYNFVNSSQSFVGAGKNHIINSTLDDNAIVAGESHAIQGASRSIIGAGYSSVIENSDDSGILSGRDNRISDSVASVIGAGEENVIDDCVAAAIMGGTGNVMQTTNHAIIGAGENITITDSTDCIIGAGHLNSISGDTNASGIVAGTSCSIVASESSVIGAGISASIRNSIDSGIVAGTTNTIANATSSLIGAGAVNTITSLTFVSRSAIVVGQNCTITGEIENSLIGTGENSLIQVMPGAAPIQNTAIIAGSTSQIISTPSGTNAPSMSLIGGGLQNKIIDASMSAIIVGRLNTIANGTMLFIGAGDSNAITSNATSIANGIIGGSLNLITGTIEYSVIGAGQSNTIRRNDGAPLVTKTAIMAGTLNLIESTSATLRGVDSCVIGAGTSNVLRDSTNTVIGAGTLNTIYNATNTFLGSGINNNITTTTLVTNCAIVAGQNNSLSGELTNVIVGSGINNVIVHATGSPALTNAVIGAGSTNIIETTAAGAGASSNVFIGAGTLNIVRDSTRVGIVSGESILIVNATDAFVGAGLTNQITSTTSSLRNAIVVGQTNTITGAITDSFIGSGSGNIIRIASGGLPLSYAFIGAGLTNLIESTSASAVSVYYNFIGAGTVNTIRNSQSSAIAAGTTNTITTSTGAFIATGTGSSITSADYASILAGTTVTVSGALQTETAFAQHVAILQTFRTPGIVTISGSHTVVLGDHIFAANGVAGTLALGTSSSTPDGMQIRVRDIGNVNLNNVVLSCVSSGCTICPPNAACAASGTDTMNVQYGTRFYVFRASLNTWYAL